MSFIVFPKGGSIFFESVIGITRNSDGHIEFCFESDLEKALVHKTKVNDSLFKKVAEEFRLAYKRTADFDILGAISYLMNENEFIFPKRKENEICD